jgi:predicted transposase YbfD/YdcC
MLRLVRQRWTIENQLHWPHDSQFSEEADRYSYRNAVLILVLVLVLLRTLALNLLRNKRFRSIRAGLMTWRMRSTECLVGLA